MVRSLTGYGARTRMWLRIKSGIFSILDLNKLLGLRLGWTMYLLTLFLNLITRC